MKKRDKIQFIGTQGGICGYLDREQIVYRASSSLTGKRTKIDPAFVGFRRSSKRMKEAAPIASALYARLSKEQKQFALFRVLTGEVIVMLKEGIDKQQIREILFQRYIEPILSGNGYKIPQAKTGASNPPLPGYKYLGRVKGFRRLKLWEAPDLPAQAPDSPEQTPNPENNQCKKVASPIGAAKQNNLYGPDRPYRWLSASTDFPLHNGSSP
jgi:hypothetical protein